MEHDSFLVIEWFQNNFTKLNGDKYHLLVGGYKQSIWAKIGDARISESNKQKLLGIYINKTLSFDKEAGRKLSVLARLSSYDSNPKESPHEILHWSPVCLLPTNLDVSW